VAGIPPFWSNSFDKFVCYFNSFLFIYEKASKTEAFFVLKHADDADLSGY
jgi:hypothetical protein